ncbi:MAG: GNAT family N-acetyltransferase [Solirubrobacterales bacterium]
MQPPRIRAAGEADVGAILDLVGELGRPARSDSPPPVRDAAAAILSRPDTAVLVAERSGRPIGLACVLTLPRLGHASPEARLLDLIVTDRSQAAGVGRQLVEEVVRRAARSGCHLLRLECGHRRESQGFYRCLGFESRGEDWQLPIGPSGAERSGSRTAG